MNYFLKNACFLMSAYFLTGCGMDATINTVEKYAGPTLDIEKKLQTQLILAQDGDTITLEEGHFLFSKSLIMEGKSDIYIRGAGMDKTVLSFAGQEDGAEGIRISNGRNITLSDFTIRDAKGDNLKVNDVNGLNILRIKSEWTGTPKAENGAYALYPVMCQNVLIEESIAIGASDAGIYVGQSRHVIVRNSKAYNNVAGIEIENTLFADVYQNEAYDNTGGILVFDLPGLSQLGGNVRVFDNKVYDNNFTNFAPAGNIVASVPPGTGMMVLAARNVEIFNNTITDNKTAGIALISYDFVEATGLEAQAMENSSAQPYMSNFSDDQAYNPYPSAIFIYQNTLENRFTFPSFENDIGYLLLFKFWLNKPEIIYDGIVNPELLTSEGAMESSERICIRENEGGTFANLDAANDFENISRDLTPHDCQRDRLPVVKFEKTDTSLDEEV